MPRITARGGTIVGASNKNSTNRFPLKLYIPIPRPAGMLMITETKVTTVAIKTESQKADKTPVVLVNASSHARKLQLSGHKSGNGHLNANDQMTSGISGKISQSNNKMMTVQRTMILRRGTFSPGCGVDITDILSFA